MTMAVTDALARGSRPCCVPHRQHLRLGRRIRRQGEDGCAVLVPQGKIAMGKLAQAVMHGARIIQVQGKLRRLPRAGPQDHRRVPTSRSGQLRQPGAHRGSEGPPRSRSATLWARAPDIHALPVGNAGNITATGAAYSEYFADGITSVRPRMLGVQAAGAAPLVHGARSRTGDHRHAIRIGARPRGTVPSPQGRVERCLPCRDRRGDPRGVPVDRRDRRSLRRARVGRERRGLLAAHKEGWLDAGQTVVCTVNRQRPQGSRHRPRGHAGGPADTGRPVAVAAALELA